MTAYLLRVAQLAVRAHHGQTRKDNGDPYILHPLRVAERVARAGEPEHVIAAALLHDVLEDTTTDPMDILSVAGTEALALVRDLTNTYPRGVRERAARKEWDRRRLAEVCREAKAIKLADRTDNMLELARTGQDARFMALYGHESHLLYAVALLDVHAQLEADYRHALEALFARANVLTPNCPGRSTGDSPAAPAGTAQAA